MDGYFYNDDVISFVVKDNSTCFSCIDCSVTGYPRPSVTWSFHGNDDLLKSPIITNESNSTSDKFLLDNGQVCLQLYQ